MATINADSALAVTPDDVELTTSSPSSAKMNSKSSRSPSYSEYQISSSPTDTIETQPGVPTIASARLPTSAAVRSSLAAHDWDLILGNRDLDEYERASAANEEINIPTIGALNIDYRLLTNISENILQDVRMLNTFLEPPAIKALVYALNRSKTVYSLTLSGCGLDDRCASYFGQLLRSQQSIEMLDLSDNAFTDMGIVTMIDGIKTHPFLRHLYCCTSYYPKG